MVTLRVFDSIAGRHIRYGLVRSPGEQSETQGLPLFLPGDASKKVRLPVC